LKADPRIDAYIAKAAPFAQPILSHVRERVRAVAPDVEETLKWGAPSFVLNGKILLMMAAFKAHAALNFWRGQELRGEEANADAMGQFGKLTSIDDLPADGDLDAMIRHAAELAFSVPAPRNSSMRRSRRRSCIPNSPRRSRARPRPRPRSTVFRHRPSAIISSGYRTRSRTLRARNASPRPSNG
jgi:hypothetical protein